MLQPQTILQHFYKMLICPVSYWFSSRTTINITFLFTNTHSPHQHFINIFVKKFVFLTLFKYENVSILQNSRSPIK